MVESSHCFHGPMFMDGLTVEALSIRNKSKRNNGSNFLLKCCEETVKVFKEISRESTGWMFPTTYGLTFNHYGTKGLIQRGDKESRTIVGDMNLNGVKENERQ